ncbi:MAG TPA: multidrug effflux MFS transporter [Thermohalobaculum sp.]|nr:multidrug effflux MFS transporter [Thermohalobaculum sp.]
MVLQSTLPSAAERAEGRSPLGFLIFLALMTSVVAMTIDAVLPALDAISEELRFTGANDRQLIVMLVFVGMGASQLVFGPLSDGIGRKRTALIGWGVFTLGTLMGMFAVTPEMMFAGRFLQGLGAGGPRVVAMAVVRDLYEGRPMARILSLVMTVFMLVPMFAPIIGQWAEWAGGWRAIFGLYLAMALVSGGWYLLGVPETLDPAQRRSLSLRPVLAAFAEVLGTRSTVFYTLSMTLIFGAFVVYLATAQQVLEEGYALGALFPWAFGALAFAFACASFANSRLVMRLGMRRLCLVALTIMIVVSAVATLIARLGSDGGNPPLWLFLVLMSLIFFSVAVLFANFNALALEPLGHLAGTAASVVNTVATLGAVPVGYVISQGYDGSVAPLFTGFAVLGVGSLGFMAMAERVRAPA